MSQFTGKELNTTNYMAKLCIEGMTNIYLTNEVTKASGKKDMHSSSSKTQCFIVVNSMLKVQAGSLVDI